MVPANASLTTQWFGNEEPQEAEVAQLLTDNPGLYLKVMVSAAGCFAVSVGRNGSSLATGASRSLRAATEQAAREALLALAAAEVL